MNGLLEVADDVLRRPVRQGYPVPIAKLPSNLLEPEYGTAIGMVLYGHRARQARMIWIEDWSQDQSIVCQARDVATPALPEDCIRARL